MGWKQNKKETKSTIHTRISKNSRRNEHESRGILLEIGCLSLTVGLSQFLVRIGSVKNYVSLVEKSSLLVRIKI